MTIEHHQPELAMQVCVTGSSGPGHFEQMRGAPGPVDRSDTAIHPEPARHLGTLSEELTHVRSRI